MTLPDHRSTPALRLRAVTKHFGGVHAVRDVDLDVVHGERRAVIGPNGAGKTTLFRLVAGEDTVSHGTVQLFGQDVTTAPMYRRARAGITRTFQTPHVFDGLSVEDNLFLSFVGAAKGRFSLRRSSSGQRERVRGLAERLGMDDLLASDVADLSHGERRQVGIAMALAGNPKLLMLDEPAAGLSPVERHSLTDLLTNLPREVTLLLIEHDMNIALGVADRVAVMHDGAIVREGSPVEIRKDELVHRLYLGSVANNG